MNAKSLFVLAVALVAGLFPLLSPAQDFPAKAVRIIVPFPPGGVVDTLGRTLASPLSRLLGQNVIIENRPGANTVIAGELLLRAPADGHAVMLMAPSFTVNPFVHKKLPFDPLRDFAGVTRIAWNPLIICAHPSLPVKTVKELVSLARARPGQLTWATSSIVGGGRLAGEIFIDAAKINMINVPYGGGAPAATAVLGGHTTMLVGNVLDCSPHIPTGKMRPIAVTSATRAPSLPDVPTIAESGYPGFDETNWFGAVVRSATPRPSKERMSADLGRALQLPEVTEPLGRLGLIAAAMKPEEFDAFIRAEMAKNEKILKKLDLKLD